MTASGSTHRDDRSTGPHRLALAVVAIVVLGTAAFGTGVSPAAAASVTATVGFNVINSGQSTVVKGKAIPVDPGSRVAVQRRLPSGTWSTRAVGTVNSSGEYSVSIRPTGVGIYALRVRTTSGYSPVVHLRVLTPLVLDIGGLGPLRLGMTILQAKATHWVTGTSAGCELSNETAIDFPPAVQAGGSFEQGKVATLRVRAGGRTLEGLKVGATEATIAASYPAPFWQVAIDSSTVDQFGVKIVSISLAGKQRYGATINSDTGKIDEIALPTIQFCE